MQDFYHEKTTKISFLMTQVHIQYKNLNILDYEIDQFRA